MQSTVDTKKTRPQHGQKLTQDQDIQLLFSKDKSVYTCTSPQQTYVGIKKNQIMTNNPSEISKNQTLQNQRSEIVQQMAKIKSGESHSNKQNDLFQKSLYRSDDDDSSSSSSSDFNSDDCGTDEQQSQKPKRRGKKALNPEVSDMVLRNLSYFPAGEKISPESWDNFCKKEPLAKFFKNGRSFQNSVAYKKYIANNKGLFEKKRDFKEQRKLNLQNRLFKTDHETFYEKQGLVIKFTEQVIRAQWNEYTADQQDLLNKFFSCQPGQNGYITQINECYQLVESQQIDMYVQSFFENEKRMSNTEPEKVLFITPKSMIEAWFRADIHSEKIQIKRQKVAQDIVAKASACSFSEIALINKTAFGQKLLESIVRSQVLGEINELNAQFYALLLSQHQLRQFLLQQLEKELQSNYKSKLNDEKISQNTSTVTAKVYKVLNQIVRCEKPAILTILANPKKLLIDEIILLVGNRYEADMIYKVMLKVQCGKNSLQLLQKCLENSVDYTWLWKEIYNTENIETWSLQQVSDFFSYTKDMDYITLKKGLSTAGVLNLRTFVLAEAVGSDVLSTQTHDLFMQTCRSKADVLKCRENFDMLIEKCTMWEKNSDGQFKLRPVQCLMAASLFKVKTKCQLFQLYPGNGKTFTNLMLAYLYQELDKTQTVYICISDVLKNQVEQKLTLLPGLNIPIILPIQVQSYFQQNCVFIFDEYYQWIRSAKLTIVPKLKVYDPCFWLGRTEQLVISTGHRSKNFVKFLQEFADQPNIQEFGHIMNIINQEARPNIELEMCDTILTANKSIEKITLDLVSQKVPVFVFGYQFTEEFLKQLPPTLYKTNLTSDDQISSVVKTAAGLNEGVICIADKFSVGVDIRFVVEASVVILASKMINREQILQMAARGVRNLGETNVYVRVVGPQQERQANIDLLTDELGQSFFDAALNLRLVDFLIVGKPTEAAIADFNLKASQSWKVSIKTFMDRYIKTKAEPYLAQANAMLQTYLKTKIQEKKALNATTII